MSLVRNPDSAQPKSILVFPNEIASPSPCAVFRLSLISFSFSSPVEIATPWMKTSVRHVFSVSLVSPFYPILCSAGGLSSAFPPEGTPRVSPPRVRWALCVPEPRFKSGFSVVFEPVIWYGLSFSPVQPREGQEHLPVIGGKAGCQAATLGPKVNLFLASFNGILFPHSLLDPTLFSPGVPFTVPT